MESGSFTRVGRNGSRRNTVLNCCASWRFHRSANCFYSVSGHLAGIPLKWRVVWPFYSYTGFLAYGQCPITVPASYKDDLILCSGQRSGEEGICPCCLLGSSATYVDSSLFQDYKIEGNIKIQLRVIKWINIKGKSLLPMVIRNTPGVGYFMQKSG